MNTDESPSNGAALSLYFPLLSLEAAGFTLSLHSQMSGGGACCQGGRTETEKRRESTQKRESEERGGASE